MFQETEWPADATLTLEPNAPGSGQGCKIQVSCCSCSSLFYISALCHCVAEPDSDLVVVNAVAVGKWLLYLWRLLRSAASVR